MTKIQRRIMIIPPSMKSLHSKTHDRRLPRRAQYVVTHRPPYVMSVVAFNCRSTGPGFWFLKSREERCQHEAKYQSKKKKVFLVRLVEELERLKLSSGQLYYPTLAYSNLKKILPAVLEILSTQNEDQSVFLFYYAKNSSFPAFGSYFSVEV